VRLFAVFWLVSAAFFMAAAYKRRAYLLPLWPSSAVTLAWALEAAAMARRWGVVLRAIVAITAAALIAFNGIYLPRRQIRECAGESLEPAAVEIRRIVGNGEPLYLYGFGEDPAPLLFYLDRDAPPLRGKLGNAPPGYVIVPASVWQQRRAEALDLTPVFESSSGRPAIVLLRHGRALAGGAVPDGFFPSYSLLASGRFALGPTCDSRIDRVERNFCSFQETRHHSPEARDHQQFDQLRRGEKFLEH